MQQSPSTSKSPNKDSKNKTNAGNGNAGADAKKPKPIPAKSTRDARKKGKKGKDPNEIILYPHFGKKVLNWKMEEQDLDTNKFLKYNVIGLLVTGTWCPPARDFMVELTALYKEINATEKVFEIIQVSNEKTEKDYKETITDERPWLYIPYNDSYIPTLLKEHNIDFLPTFLIFNRDMFPLSENGRKDMIDNPGMKAYEKWYKAYRARKELLEKEKEDNEVVTD